MKIKLLGCTASSLVLCLSAQAVHLDPSGSPYQPITERNVFGLKAPPPPPDPEANKPPPPNITLTGILAGSVFGGKRALMKTPPPAGKPGAPAPTEQSYILGVGQREGDIEVLEIDEKAGSVKVNNAGSVVTLTFEKNGAKPGAGAAPPPGLAPTGIPGIPGGIPTAAANSGFPTPAGMPPRQIRQGTPLGAQSPPGVGIPSAVTPSASASIGGVNYANGQQGLTPAQQIAAQRSPEENVLLYEANRMKNQQLIQSGARIPPMPAHPMMNGGPQRDPADMPPPPLPQ